MDTRPIGVFDSGLGGLSAVRELQCCLPGEDIVYFGDTGRVPYGTRSESVISSYAEQDSRFLLSQGVKMILAACGTVSSVAENVLSKLPVPAIGVIEPAAARAAAVSRNGKIGVIGTAATVRSGAFARHIAALRPEAQVVSAACPLFVPLVESGWIEKDNEITRLTVERYLKPLKEQGIDTLVLGCTHFPLLAPVIADFLGEEVTLVDAGREVALRCAEVLAEKQLLGATEKRGEARFFVSDRPQDFARIGTMFLGHDVGETELVDIESV